MGQSATGRGPDGDTATGTLLLIVSRATLNAASTAFEMLASNDSFVTLGAAVTATGAAPETT